MTAAQTELARLRALSARLGEDVTRTQGAGGNTSLKADGTMWIKASGTWLAEAERCDIMVPVDVEPLREAFRDGDPRAEKATDFVLTDRNPSGLRPSIETSVHAVIDHPVVLHIHCVETIALAVRTDAREEVARRLSGIEGVDWAHVPYRRPGVPLGKAIVDAQTPGTNVHILANHGLVVSGTDVGEAEARLERVVAALRQPTSFPAPEGVGGLDALAAGSPYRPASDPIIHSLAASPWRVEIASGGPMYPDHVIFLGSQTGVLSEGRSLSDFGSSTEPPKIVVAPGRGVFLHESVDRGGELMARCLAEVAARLPEGAPLRRLTGEEVHALTNWEAEKYRQTLGRQASNG
ncbi:class II aldolase/adducin family protein [Aureimonas psammosilenae]|uniref:class II aldolase/adducin family protein n=1 Tax=Aureimonas psammosilenae TaxID=2495496 RepID=UPI0012612FB3|nr:class II aldolase/adducin family protein [Aureimonas psammosilenae]